MHQPQPPEPDPDDDLDQLGQSIYQGDSLQVRGLTEEEFARFLAAHANQPGRLVGSGWANLEPRTADEHVEPERRLTFNSLFHKPVRTNGEAAAWGAARDAPVPRCPGDALTEGRSHNDTLAGCIVSSTTASSSPVSVSRSTCWRSLALNAAIVRAASYRRRSKRRSTTAWMRRRAGWNAAATARVAVATTRGESRPSSWPRPRTTPA
jgi:hypothetical protein